MLCPACQVDLQMTERQGVEIDYCPKCRGVWLDRGELDMIIERAAADVPAAPTARYAPDDRRYGDDRRYDEKRKKRGFLGELFD
jgi:Zn-finger nucleic acid-binding protein